MIKGIDIKLNVRPIYIGLVHLSVYEGPCRFGNGEELTPEHERIANKELNEDFIKEVETNLSINEVNLLTPIYIERFDDLLSNEETFDKMSEDSQNVDIYLISSGIARGGIVIEFAERFNKPIAMVPERCCMIAEVVAAMDARGLESYGYMSWADCISHFKALRVRKVLKNTNILLAPRMNSNNSMASDSTFVSLEMVTRVLGTRFRYINAHELIDQTHKVDSTTNYTTPGRTAYNIDEKDLLDIENITEELIKDASECNMEKESVLKSVKAYYTVKKLLDVYDCNAFSMPCPDICASRRLDQEQITFCLTHSLLNELGIPSACEYDISALVSMQVLINFSGGSAYMGNTNPILYEKGEAQPIRTVSEDDLKDIKTEPNLYFTFHSTPNRKLKGFNKPEESYGIQPFSFSGFGATLRYDFKKDVGQTISMTRFSPDCKKMFVAKGTIKGGAGYNDENCTLSVIFQVENQKDFFNKQIRFGNHIPLVYGDYVKELTLLGDALGLEVVSA